MSTRATYAFTDSRSSTRTTTTVYCHHDGYQSGAAARFYQMLINPSKGNAASQFIRAVDDAEITDGHDAHGDTEFRYDLKGYGPAALISVSQVKYCRSGWNKIVVNAPLHEWIASHTDLIEDFQPFREVKLSYRSRILNRKLASDLLNGEGLECILRTLRVWAAGGHTNSGNWKSMVSDLRAVVKAFPELMTDEIEGYLGECKMRPCTCFDCKHEWNTEIKPAGPFCPNISGEATNYCPKCNGRNVQSGPVFYAISN